MNNFFDNQRILVLIWKRKFHFIIVGLIAVVLSAIFSGPAFITPKYKSTARIYPTNIWTMSDESETEQMLEVLNSNDIKFRMFDTFELDKVYNIDKETPQYLTYLLAEYGSNVKASKTEYETAEIEVLDEDPQRASDMCDSIISFYNQKVRALHKEKSKEMVDITSKQIRRKDTERQEYEHKLDSIRKAYGIISYGQVDEITRGYMNALAAGRGSTGDAKKIEKLYDNFASEGSRVYRLETEFRKAASAVDSLRLLHDAHVIEYEKEIAYSHIVEYPFPADKKAYPVRWLIVAFTTLSALFFALITFLVLDYGKKE